MNSPLCTSYMRRRRPGWNEEASGVEKREGGWLVLPLGSNGQRRINSPHRKKNMGIRGILVSKIDEFCVRRGLNFELYLANASSP